ncbi:MULTISPECIES: hypothetical protein [Gordonia]|uniref:N-acetyltransferase domain-containing protein n=2 Tax=Gordonia TaxID=2053 RepID=L7LL05_9ACTN|nr:MULTISPECIES: hypothetical protein [Gordonia]AUH67898.1 hypothetical protein CXX93_05520 [Gordonia sp. YC-JH1]KJR07187.1 hypothetical protein UG54_11545 [Gordonia sihwensis]KXT58137.1 hypothetical protein Y710_04580 [Gordonia sp. QH-12]MBY4569620.1 hypothetical protein [Gordonia sihwensis]GAC60723.1 hypothetical protein GSI01S_11_00650 [Gordonia sihwensis NBRC 108236]
MTEIVTLDDTDLTEAVRLAAHGIREIPLYQWLLGEHVGDSDKREWLARLLLRPLLRVGCVTGARSDGRLVGVLVWQPHDVDLSPDGEPPLTPADVEVAARTPGLRERLAELWTQPPLWSPVEDAVNCTLTTVEPGGRGGRTLIDMMRVVERYCAERDRPFYAWTGSPELRDWFVAGWAAEPFATTDWHGRTMYGVLSGRPPVPAAVPRERDAV